MILRYVEKHPRLDFSVDALAGETYRCRLVFLSPTAAVSTRSFPAELMVIDPDPRMADGMTVRVQFPLADNKQTIKIPSSWVTEANGKIGRHAVENGKALFRAVTLGAYYDQRVEILEGMDGNEKVITNPSGIKSGDSVRSKGVIPHVFNPIWHKPADRCSNGIALDYYRRHL